MTPTRQEAIEAMKVVKSWCDNAQCAECPIHSVSFGNIKRSCAYNSTIANNASMPYMWNIDE